MSRAQGETNVLAFDLGATSGRAILGSLAGGKLEIQEIHRFPNEAVRANGELHWDILRLWHEMQAGLRLAGSQTGRPVASIGVDTWGVDYALLGERGALLENPYHYRDARTRGHGGEGLRRGGGGPHLRRHRHPVHGPQHALPALRRVAADPAPAGRRRRAGDRAGPVELLAHGRDPVRIHRRHHHAVPGPAHRRVGVRSARRSRHSHAFSTAHRAAWRGAGRAASGAGELGRIEERDGDCAGLPRYRFRRGGGENRRRDGVPELGNVVLAGNGDSPGNCERRQPAPQFHQRRRRGRNVPPAQEHHRVVAARRMHQGVGDGRPEVFLRRAAGDGPG